MQKITPFLWFNDKAEDAMNFYVSIFKNSKILNVSRYGETGPLPVGTVMIANFEINGQEIMVLNGGPFFPFTEAFSLFVNCDSQQEVDELWEKLTDGGEPAQCGWLKDRYGLSWQIVPSALGQLMGSGTPQHSQRVMESMLKMNKIDVPTLQRAFDGQ